MRAVRTLAVVVALLGAPLVTGSVEARAEELPSLVRALDEASDSAAESALSALQTAADRDSIVAGTVRDTATFATLSETTQRRLLATIVEFEVPYANAGLRSVVRSEDFSIGIREVAADALGVRGTLADVTALGDALSTVPKAASRALVSIGGRSAESVLRRGSSATPHPAISAALVRLGDREELRPLVEMVGDPEEGPGIAELLRWATGKEHGADEDAWRTFARRLSIADQLGHADPKMSQTAARELAAVLGSHTSSTLEGDLIALVAEGDWSLFAREKSALVLGLGGSTAARDVLLHACRPRKDTQEGSLRLYAAEALGRVGDLTCAMPFARILVHDEDRDRIKARRASEGEYFPVDAGLVRALLRMGCRGAVEPILELLAGEYRTRMHRDALRALREVTAGNSFGYEPDSQIADREAALKRIRAWWAENRAALPLAPSADDPGWDAFRADVAVEIENLGAFKFLHQLRAKKALVIVAEPALPQLLAALDNDVLHVRMGAAEVLAIAAPPEAVDALVERLADEDNAAARSKLLNAIARCSRRRIGTPEPDSAWLQAVSASLDDRVLDVRIAAARVIGVLGTREDAAQLARARDEERNAVSAFRATAGAARLALGDAGGLADVLVELRSDDALRRSDGANALRAAGVELHDYDPDAPAEDRAEAIREIERVPGAGRR